jgi:myo-inositol 2-dehydrogenase/D-chiro-inositol 1-dehydrogenase
MAEVLRIGFIGAGGAAGQHLRALRPLGRTVVAAISDADPGRAARAAAEWGGVAYTDYRRMLDDVRLDAVWICLPPRAGGEACLIVADRQIPFMAEKPLAVDPGLPARVAAVTGRSGLVVAVGYQWRALDFLPRVRARLSERPPRLVVARWIGDTPAAPWWIHRDEGGGQVLEQATHQYDFARFLLGEATVVGAIAARHDRPAFPLADVDDVTAAVLRFENGAIGSFAATCLAASFNVQVEFISEGLVTTITNAGSWPDFHWTVAFDDGDRVDELRTTRNAYQAEDEAFIEAVLADAPDRVLCTYEDALLTDRLTRAVMAAAQRTGAPAP